MKIHQHLNLAVDTMFTNNIPFLISHSRHVCFGTMQPLDNGEIATVMKGMKLMINQCNECGFHLDFCSMDGEFESDKDKFTKLSMTLNLCGANDHVGDMERFIVCTTKERV